MRGVRPHRAALDDGPARDPVSERGTGPEDLVGPLRPDVHRHEQLADIVSLVDVKRVVRDERADGVGDSLEQRIQALNREHLVEHVREAAIGRDERLCADEALGLGRNEPNLRRASPRAGGRVPCSGARHSRLGHRQSSFRTCSSRITRGRRFLFPRTGETPRRG
jgi:hypothetical protein